MTDARTTLTAAGRHLSALGLSPGTSGNISLRTPDGILVTPTGGSLAALETDRLSLLDGDGRVRTGPPPTKEVPLHRAVHAHIADAAAVVHLHSTYAVALACTEPDDPADTLLPFTPYTVMRLGRVPLLPYAPPGTLELADGVRQLAMDTAAFLLAQHGPVTIGRDLDEAVSRAIELEEACRLQLVLLPAPVVRALTPAQRADLAAQTRHIAPAVAQRGADATTEDRA
ncbi:class II aldolase/adducin family protein [Streptomyces sp. Lzd4kr]|nr:class II aldolase/adducin family protein [Streptomyces sp. Lzd4kr]